MSIEIVPMTLAHYAAALALWQATEGVGLSPADERAPIARYLQRNPGLSFVAWDENRLVGAVLCGHDGRRGYIHHLAVAASHRRRGIGTALVDSCLAGLRANGIDKCHLFVFRQNQAALAFWRRIGWTERTELALVSRFISEQA